MIVNTQISGGGAKTYLVVTVTGDESDVVGGTVTATSLIYNNVSYTGTTDNNGSVSFEVDYVGTYDITYSKTDVPTTTIKALFGIVGGVNAVTLDIDYGFVFSLIYDSTTIQTDPTGCLTYADDCAGFTPVSSPPSSLGRCGTIGSWQMNADGTSTNLLLKKCFYATFHDNGSGALCLHEKLNPQDLTKKIAVWDNDNKVWVPTSGSSSITTEETMFCIPTIYAGYASSKFYLSSAPITSTSAIQAYAHTIENHTYDYLAIGVYASSSIDSDYSQFYSRSGSNPVFVGSSSYHYRVQNKTVQNGYSTVINFYQWHLLQWMIMFAMKSWNGQSQIGQGGYNGTATGMCDTLGPFAGSTSTTPSADSSVKAFIENPWGAYGGTSSTSGNGIVLGDTIYRREGSGTSARYYLYAGQNSTPDESYSNLNLIYSFGSSQPSGWVSGPSVSFATFGISMSDFNGSSTTGTCDYQEFNTSGTGSREVSVGGGYMNVEDGKAGPFWIRSGSSAFYTTGREVFVFDL